MTKLLNKKETKALLVKLGVPRLLQSNTLAGGLYTDYITGVLIKKIGDDKFMVSEAK